MRKMQPEVEAALLHGKRRIREAHGDDPNVTGVGVSYRFRGGKWTDEPVVTVMVAKKRPEALVSRRRLLPKTVEVDGKAWGVDVVQAGPARLHSAPAASAPPASGPAVIREAITRGVTDAPMATPLELTRRVRPPVQGCSISNPIDGRTAGTFGCLVRDRTDQSLCLLSANHVIARLNQGRPDEQIIQPGMFDGGAAGADRIAGLKRFAPLADGTEVDGAIARLDDQAGATTRVMDDLMAPISPVHPTVGMVVAGDAFGNSYLTRMDATLTALNVSPVIDSPGGPGASTGVVAPQIGMNIEKVGRTTGYTTATILGTGFDILVGTPSGPIEYQNLIWTLLFDLPGDSGSVACAGGAGNLAEALIWLAIIEALLASCLVLEALTDYYDIPLSTPANSNLSDQLRDHFLAQSVTGRLLITTTYVNSQTVIDRLNTNTGPAHNQSAAQGRAQQLYSQFHDLAATLITSQSPTAVVTSSELNTVASILFGLAAPVSIGGTAMLTQAESAAAWALWSQVLAPTQGMTRRQLIEYMNQSTVFQQVYNQIAGVPTLEVHGPVSLYRP